LVVGWLVGWLAGGVFMVGYWYWFCAIDKVGNSDQFGAGARRGARTWWDVVCFWGEFLSLVLFVTGVGAVMTVSLCSEP
jgi:hypothetical protein